MFLSLLFGTLLNSSAVPLQLTQQGRLLDSAGAAVTGTHSLHFRIYDSLSGGTQLWSEPLSVNFNNGYYATVLGTDEQNNPLDSDTLSQYPVYLEIQLDSNAAMHPRQAINSVPYAQISGVSESLDGGSVNASQIWVNNIPVVDSSGAWVGPTPSLTWADVAAKPPGFADNADNDSLGGLSCSVGEIAAWTGSAWGCASDNTLDSSGLGTLLNSTAYDLNVSTTLGGDDIVTSLTDQDSLGSLSCLGDGEVAKYDIVTSSWYCAEAITETEIETYVTNSPLDLDADTTKDSEIIVTIPSTCTDGQILSFDQANNRANCVDLNAILDQDGDGYFAWVDCDDSDPNATFTGTASTCPATSCLEILNETPSAADGNYWIDPAGSAIEVVCDMNTDGGGYTYYAVSGGLTTSTYNDNNTCKTLGMDIVMPRSQAHWDSMISRFSSSYFPFIPGVYKASSGGNYTGCAMNSSGCSDWRVGDGGSWWLRSSTYSEPNGDYTAYCWLGTRSVASSSNITYNDGNCIYSGSSYICSTNDK